MTNMTYQTQTRDHNVSAADNRATLHCRHCGAEVATITDATDGGAFLQALRIAGQIDCRCEAASESRTEFVRRFGVEALA